MRKGNGYRMDIAGLWLAPVLVAFTCSGVPAAAGETSLFMDSEPGDYIGQGLQWYYTPNEADFYAVQYNQSRVSVHLDTFDPAWGWWDLVFEAPDGGPLVVGDYYGATRWPFNGPGEPGLSVSGMGRGCNTLTGHFSVYEVVYGPNTEVVSFWATFEQHCEGGPSALIGDIRFNAEGPVPVVSLSWGAVKSRFKD